MSERAFGGRTIDEHGTVELAIRVYMSDTPRMRLTGIFNGATGSRRPAQLAALGQLANPLVIFRKAFIWKRYS